MKTKEILGDLLLDAYGIMFKKQLLVVLLVLASIAGSLFAIFTLLATMSFGGTLGLVLFLMVTALLIAGYMLGFMVFAFLAILFLAKYWSRRSK
ncbi:MAG: hypothetical protein ACHQ03_11560 [Candidatus Bathyarchaeia archaeon]